MPVAEGRTPSRKQRRRPSRPPRPNRREGRLGSLEDLVNLRADVGLPLDPLFRNRPLRGEWGRKVEKFRDFAEEYAPAVRELLGADPRPFRVQGYGAPTTALADAMFPMTSGRRGQIRLSPANIFQYDSAPLWRGVAIHELAHNYGAGMGTTDRRVEALAELARLILNPRQWPGFEGWPMDPMIPRLYDKWSEGRNVW